MHPTTYRSYKVRATLIQLTFIQCNYDILYGCRHNLLQLAHNSYILLPVISVIVCHLATLQNDVAAHSWESSFNPGTVLFA